MVDSNFKIGDWTPVHKFEDSYFEDATDFIVREIGKMCSSPRPQLQTDSALSNKNLLSRCKILENKVEKLEREQEKLKEQIENKINKKKIVIK